jgi:hypothetical protein
MCALTLYQATRFIGMHQDPAQSAPVSIGVPLMMAGFWVLFYAVMTVINIVTYTQDLYGDTGYLVFGLPLRGAEVLGSRIVLLVFDTLMTLLGGMTSVIILACLGVLAVIVSFMSIMFFGVTFGKTLTNSKKHLGSVFSALVVIVVLWLSAQFGLVLEETMFSGVRLYLRPWKNLPFLGAGSEPATFPLVSPLLFVVLGVLAFVMTSWLMNRKLNL